MTTQPDHKPLSADEIASARDFCAMSEVLTDVDEATSERILGQYLYRALDDLELARGLLRESAFTSHDGLCWCTLYPYLGEHSLRCDRIRAYLASAEEAP